MRGHMKEGDYVSCRFYQCGFGVPAEGCVTALHGPTGDLLVQCPWLCTPEWKLEHECTLVLAAPPLPDVHEGPRVSPGRA